MSALLAGTVFAGGELAAGWVRVDDGRVAEVGRGEPPAPPTERLAGTLAPGLVDLQVNGAAGHEVTEDAAALDAIEAALTARGVTRFLATVTTRDDAAAAAAVERLGPRVADPASPIAGIHLEGPFLSPSHPGIHPTVLLRHPAHGVPAHYRDPAVRLVTLAPELPGALGLIEELRGRGVAVSLGHSGAAEAEVLAAVDAGAGLVTHVFNAMAPLHHRSPGLAAVALTDPRLVVGVIADGLHVAPRMLELVRRAAEGRVALVSDASSAASAAPGAYRLGGVAVERAADGSVRGADGRLAGSSILLDDALAGWARMTGEAPAAAIASATAIPARAAGLDAAAIEPGAVADLVELDDALRVRRVMRGGVWGHDAPR